MIPPTDCPHATPATSQTVTCDLLPANVRVNLRACQRCQRQWTDGNPPTAETLTPTLIQLIPSRGLGDTIAKAAAAVGISPCGGCNERKVWLNEAVPYGAGRRK